MRQAGDKDGERSAVEVRALADLFAGDVERAREGFLEMLALAGEVGNPAALPDGLHGLAVVAARTGAPETAAQLLAAAAAFAEQRGIRVERLSTRVAAQAAGEARAALGDVAFDAALAAGRALTVAEAIAAARAPAPAARPQS